MVSRRSQNFIASENEQQMSVISTEKLWEEMRREKAEAEQQFLSFAPFTMDPQKGLFITVSDDVEKRSGRNKFGCPPRSKSSVAFVIRTVMAGLAYCSGKTTTVWSISVQLQTRTFTVTVPRF